MKDKIKSLTLKAYAMSPFACGIVLGYFGQPIISFLLKLLG